MLYFQNLKILLLKVLKLLLVLEGISKVVFGCPNFRFGGCGSVINANDAPLEDHPAPLVVSSIVMLSALL